MPFSLPATLTAGDVNTIAIDWSAGSSLYTVGLTNAPSVGEYIATFINILNQSFGYNPELVTIVGVGLGGHIAGIAARQVQGSVAHIVGVYF